MDIDDLDYDLNYLTEIYDDFDYLTEIYDDFIDSSLVINQNIINNIHNIRRQYNNNFLEQETLFDDYNLNLFGNDYEIDNTNTNFNRMHSSMINIIFGLFLDNTFNNHDFEDVKVTLTKSEFNKFKRISLTNNNINDYSNKECNICMEEYKLKNTLISLPCKHLFHKKCIQNWLCNEKVSCPICRKDMRIT